MEENMGAKILELLKAKKKKELHELLSQENCADIAAEIETLLEDEEITREELLVLFRILPKDIASDTFVEMAVDTQEILIKGFNDKELREVLDDLFLDDTVDIIEEMPANVVKRILQSVDADTRKSINQLLNYPEDSAGSIMTIEYVDLKKTMTVEQSFARIRKTGVDKETIYTCYVTDKNRKLLGLVSVKDLLLAQYEDVIDDIMEENIISVNTCDDQEVVAQMFSKYDFIALPVVDSEGRLVGIITVDDAIDVMQEEFTEDIEKMNAIVPTDKPYLKMTTFELWKARIPWLLLLMVSATFTGMIISSFEVALAAQVALVAYIPMLMDTGGNSGSQSSVTVIRGLSLGEVEFSDWLKIIWKEARVAVVCGITLAAANFVKLMLFDRVGLMVSLAVNLTLILTVFVAKIVGCTLPMISKKMGFDPAVMSAPFITTIVDAISLLVYFTIAQAILGL
ncbi:MAG: magnesium transporter [Oscillospiraceae bacterium]